MMCYLKRIMKSLQKVFGSEFVKNPTVDNAMQGFFTSTLSNKDTSFAIIGVRCNDNDSTGKRKMCAGMTYRFIHGYDIMDGTIAVSSSQIVQNTMYDDFYNENINGIPHIQISAIVGQNGSGKSSIVEFMMRLINNFAAATIGEMQNSGRAAEHIHFIDGVNGDLWYLLEGNAYRLSVKNCNVTLYKFEQKKPTDNGVEFSCEECFWSNNKDINCKELKAPHPSLLSDEELKQHYGSFFYTLISNQSIYAYNTLDFQNECNSDEKEAMIVGSVNNQKFDIEDKCWLHGLFHKNDAYRTPLVITPFRREGNIDINNERELAIERLVRLYALHEELRTINEHLLVESLTYSFVPEQDYDLERIRRKLNFKNLTSGGYDALKQQIIAEWGRVIGMDLTSCQNRPYYKEAIGYLVYKTLKVSFQYKEHRDFYEAACTMDDVYNEDTLNELIISLSQDHSHITRKIFQTLAYLKYRVFEFDENTDNVNVEDDEGCIEFDELGKKWYKVTQMSTADMKSSLLVHLRMQAIVPPPFLTIRINLCEKSNRNVKIDFESLSSGEKQQIFTISSILYHLDNLDSAHKDESITNRITYRNVCVILEEIELYYHPQLQQQFILYFLNGLKELNLEQIKSIHLIIVTHSPYVLSDIPRTNVLALKKDENEPIDGMRTFGANVYDMLKDSFFLEGGAMGMFAQWEVAHLMSCMKVHQWARESTDKKHCPFVGEGGYEFLDRYLYPNSNNMKDKLFSYEQFSKDLSSRELKERILLMDEPVVYHVLMEEYARTFPDLEKDEKEMKRADLLRQLKELDD